MNILPAKQPINLIECLSISLHNELIILVLWTGVRGREATLTADRQAAIVRLQLTIVNPPPRTPRAAVCIDLTDPLNKTYKSP